LFVSADADADDFIRKRFEEATMTLKRYVRLFPIVFTIASVGFLIDSTVEQDGTRGEVLAGTLLIILGLGWVTWEFLLRTQQRL
jgi:hypothetical protein